MKRRGRQRYDSPATFFVTYLQRERPVTREPLGDYRETQCECCGGFFKPRHYKGPEPKFCTTACRMAAYRRRKDPSIR